MGFTPDPIVERALAVTRSLRALGSQIFHQPRMYEALKDAGIGAISTRAVETPFSIKDTQNQLQGQIRATSIYLNETGTAGTVQQVDLAS